MGKKCLFLLNRLMPVLIFVFLASEGSTQSQYTDSLLRVISGKPDNSEKADNYIKLAKYYMMTNKDSAWSYSERAYTMASQFNHPEAVADALYLKSLLFSMKNNTQEAISYNEKFLQIADSLNDNIRLAKGNYNMGNLLTGILEYDNALEHFRKSLAIYIDLKDTNGIALNYNSIGTVFSTKSAYDSAAIYYLNAVNIYEKTGEDKYLGSILSHISEVYLEQGQLETSRKYVIRSKEIYTKYNDSRGIALDFTLLGRISSDDNDYNGALENYRQAEAIYVRMGDSIGIGDILNNIGVVYNFQKNYSMAIQSYEKALDIYREKNYKRGIIVTLGNIAAVYCDQGRYSEALALHDTVLGLSHKYEFKEYQKDALWNISDTYRKAGNYQKAFDYLLLFSTLKDSLYNIEKNKLINDLTFKYEKEKDQAHILALEKDNLQKTNQRNAYMFSGLGIIVLALFMIIYFRQRAVHEKLIATQKIRQLEEEKKLMAAKLLVEGQEEERKRIATELHDGLGVLLSATKMQFSTISDKSPENKVLIDKATKMLEQATGDVRKISHNMMPGLLTKLGFFEAVEDLFEHIGDTKDLYAVCNISGNQDRLSENKEIMLYRIVQEMVNNTLKHAEAKNIKIQIIVSENKLDINYSDDGIGFDVVKKMETESIGLKSIQSRVNFLNGTMAVKSRHGEGATYSIQIPV